VLHKAASVAARVDHKDKGEGGAAASRGQDATGWGEAMLPEVCGGATRGRRDCCNDGGRYCCTSNILHRAPTMEVRRRSSWRGCAGRGCCIGKTPSTGVLGRWPWAMGVTTPTRGGRWGKSGCAAKPCARGVSRCLLRVYFLRENYGDSGDSMIWRITSTLQIK
jgi:hypothetical protein